MANWVNSTPRGSRQTAEAFHAGLRTHMLRVYNYMSLGVLLTGLVAFLFARSGLAFEIFTNGGVLSWAAILAPLAIVLVMSFGANRMEFATLQALFWVYAGLMGISLSMILLVYTGESVAMTFFATAAAFASLSLYGYTTKRDLGPIGTFLIMGLVGLIVAMIANMFMQSEVFSLAISAIGVLIFAGLTAYDTQKIKSEYFHVAGTSYEGKAAIIGALELYLDFVNLFLHLLKFMGDRD